MNQLLAQLAHQPFPRVADALRLAEHRITAEWVAAVCEAMPQMQHLSFDQVRDSTPAILQAIADALASDDPVMICELLTRAPNQGLSRLSLNLGAVEVMQEDRLLRAIIVQQVEAGLQRRMDVHESAALHAAVDVMLQHSVIALVEQQKAQLRASAESELKFLSFLSHDLSNNLNGVTMWLHLLANEMKSVGGYEAAESVLDQAQASIHSTVVGMRRMLDHERLRQSNAAPAAETIDLHEAATKVVQQIERDAGTDAVAVEVTVPLRTMAYTDPDLLGIVLQNLVGNAVKYSKGGTVRVGCQQATRPCRKVLFVSDEGPGISPEKVGDIFGAFRRGEVHGQPGVGLGLAIASQAARLLNAKLGVESKVGVGSTFELHLPKCNASRCAVSITTLGGGQV